MRTLTNLLAIGLLSFTALHAQESNMSSTVKASEMYADGFSKFRFGGYGEMAASYMDYDWNWVTPQGTSHMNRATVSIPRFILAFDYKFSPKWVGSFNGSLMIIGLCITYLLYCSFALKATRK